MDTEERPGSCPATAQTPVRTWLSSSSRGVPGTPSDSASRFLGDGVRYKAKLIGIDPVPDAQGEKMCWDSMMKLKGFEAAARRQGKHKQRVWLKVSSSGLKIMDERTGILLYDHDRTRISSLRKDESDPRALAYVYQHQDTYILYYIKMANLADPVLIDIKEVCQGVDQETPQEAAEAPTQTSSLLLLNDSPAPPAEGPALEDVFSPDSSPGQSNQASSTNELMEIFSIQMEDPMMPTQTSCTSHSESSTADALQLSDPLHVPHTTTKELSILLSSILSHLHALGSTGVYGKSMGRLTCGTLAHNAWKYDSMGTSRHSSTQSRRPDGGSQLSARIHEGRKHTHFTCFTHFTHCCHGAPHPFKLPLCSCWRNRSTAATAPYLRSLTEESVDVKALRARFNNKTSTSDASSRDSGSPKSPRPGFGRVTLPGTENDLAYRRVSPTIPPPVMAGPGLMRFPRAEPMASPIPSRPAFFPRPPPHPGVRPSIQPADTNKIKQTGDMLQNMMLGHQRLPGIKPGPALPPLQAPVPAPASAPLPLRQQSRQRSAGDVTPLRRPLPPEGPLPLKPKRPPHVNLEPFMRTCRGPAPSCSKKIRHRFPRLHR
ncbi:Disabled-like protein 2 [Larimichthys crocea]|uniref:Uncharacterized protein n=1 Tax=Larimichthys crocea TaxID=215358 RepID=A0ACD3RLV2_LARCR|nr:Disabled-like protein 2 [Larimichthys crocea]